MHIASFVYGERLRISNSINTLQVKKQSSWARDQEKSTGMRSVACNGDHSYIDSAPNRYRDLLKSIHQYRTRKADQIGSMLSSSPFRNTTEAELSADGAWLNSSSQVF